LLTQIAYKEIELFLNIFFCSVMLNLFQHLSCFKGPDPENKIETGASINIIA
jgi:hypothetical protein